MTTRSFALLCAASAVFRMAGASPVEAQHPYGVLSEPAYRELRQLSRNVNDRAQDANERAQRGASRAYRNERSLLGPIADFARGTRRFDERMDDYRAAPWRVDDDIERLFRSAQDVRERVRHSRFTDDNTLSDWNEIVEILSRMMKVSRFEEGVVGSAPGGPGRDEYGERSSPPGPRVSGELAALVHELDDRAARAHGLAQRVADQGPYRREFFQAIRDFHDQVVAFRRNVEAGAIESAQIRAEAGRLLDSARRTDQNMRRRGAFPEVWPEWQEAIGVLQRILRLVRG